MTALPRAQRWRAGVGPAIGFGAGAGAFAGVALVLTTVRSDVGAVALGGLCVLALIAIARTWSVAYAVPPAMASYLAFDWYEFPPTHAPGLPGAGDLADLATYVAIAVLIGELAAQAARRAEASREALARLAREQAALRRVATLVARGVPTERLLAAVAHEAGELLAVDAIQIGRHEPGGATAGVASWSRGPEAASLMGGRLADRLRASGLRSTASCPILVGAERWGVMVAASRSERALGPEEVSRMAAFAELVATGLAHAKARSALAASRARVVAAADAERRRVVRDLHDGAQQRLVHTVITLKLARSALEQGAGNTAALVHEALAQAEQATAELRELAHGILPAVLTVGGLRAGVEALASRMPIPIDVDVPIGRLAPDVEATAYFVVAEALTNVAKHAAAGRAAVTARVEDGALRLEVRDDGRGGARPDGSGLLGLADRLTVLDGRLAIASPPGDGTQLSVAIPLR